MADTPRPTPPDHLDGEALLEWQRVCDALLAAGRPVELLDLPLLEVWADTWAQYRQAQRHIDKHGSVVKLSNGVVCASPYYKVRRETALLLRSLANDMGITFVSRPKTAPAENEDLPI